MRVCATSSRRLACRRGHSLTTSPSKEAFGLEIIDLYLDQARDVIAATLRNDE
jgi:hypothetical protein